MVSSTEKQRAGGGTALADSEPLPGYTLTERLGSGGYGEVWRAEVPGGLAKAIKFVYGQEHESRASHEFRALQRIKAVRHPFLLSLERIEIVDGRLVVVTELADESLKDRYISCRQQGLPGIPRAELIRHLSEAADALDFLVNEHGLQHLDIKPENLLLVAGHVKVADFGLVKDVRESQASLVGGMTPIYCPPEVFRGCPNKHSDQYSLAIVYHEMLAGTLPFPGVTAAELTLQHLNDEPDLSALSGADRFSVSRAMSKNPDHRFGSCREFIEALLQTSVAGPPSSSEATPQPGPRTDTNPTTSRSDSTLRSSAPPTSVCDEELPDATAGATKPIVMEIPEEEAVVEDLPPPEFDSGSFVAGPTVFLGIGGTACRVLHQLNQRIRARFGDGDLPAVKTLLIDTDPKSLLDVTRGERSGLASDAALHLPLRRPQGYREHSSRLLQWLNRRWLFNIPRSQRTEGIRPLGRLALVDHARQACQRIRRALAAAVEPDAIEASAEATGMKFHNEPVRVYLVASISGGTGSGMVLDVAYAVKAMLKKLEIHNAQVIGILMHSTARDHQSTELARVNAYSCLSEWRHFDRPGVAYSGDDSCGLPAHEADVAPFDHTYLVPLGDGLSDVDYQRATESVAEYLRLDAMTAAQTFFDACRRADEDSKATPPKRWLRTFEIQRLSAAPTDCCRQAVQRVCPQVLAGWCCDTSRDSNNPDQQIPELVARRASQVSAEVRLEADALMAHVRGYVDEQLGDDTEDFLARQLGLVSDGETASAAESGDGPLGRLFAPGAEQSNWSIIYEYTSRGTSELVEPLRAQLQNELRRLVIQSFDDPQLRLGGTRQLVEQLDAVLRDTAADLSQIEGSVAGRVAELHPQAAQQYNEFRRQKGTASADTAPSIVAYTQVKLEQDMVAMAQQVVGALASDLKALADEATEYGRQLQGLMAQLESASADPDDQADESSSAEAWIREHLGELTEPVNQRLQQEFIAPSGGLFKIIMGGGRLRAQLIAALIELAETEVPARVVQMHVPTGLAGQVEEMVQKDRNDSSLGLLHAGGKRRLLAVLPESSGDLVDQLSGSDAGETKLSTVVGDDNSVSLCMEAKQIPFISVAINMIQHRRDYLEFAKRVHTRSDIRWSDVLDEAKASTPITPIMPTQVLEHAEQD